LELQVLLLKYIKLNINQSTLLDYQNSDSEELEKQISLAIQTLTAINQCYDENYNWNWYFISIINNLKSLYWLLSYTPYIIIFLVFIYSCQAYKTHPIIINADSLQRLLPFKMFYDYSFRFPFGISNIFKKTEEQFKENFENNVNIDLCGSSDTFSNKNKNKKNDLSNSNNIININGNDDFEDSESEEMSNNINNKNNQLQKENSLLKEEINKLQEENN